MRRVSPVVRLIGICLVMTFFATAQDTALKGKPELDPQSIIDDSNKLIERIRQAVSESGGDLSTQRVQWVFALSTGHYGKDPQGARAAREVAQYLVRELAAPEDSVTVRAWEMTLWDHLSSDNRRKILDDPADLEPQALGRLWPTTPVKDSKGGHDTEKVIVDLVAELGNSRDAILVLITNTAASVAAKGTKLIGTNAADYLKTLEEWRRVEGDKDGATQKVNYLVAAAGKTTTSKLEVVVVLPRKFSAASFAGEGTRDSVRVGSAVEETPVATQEADSVREEPIPDSSGGGAGWLVIVLVAVVVLVGGFFALRGGGGSLFKKANFTVVVGKDRYSLSGYANGDTICTVAGAGFQDAVSGGLTTIDNAPPVAMVRLVKERRGVRIVDGDFKFVSLDGDSAASNLIEATDGAEHSVQVEGEAPSKGGFSLTQQINLTIRFAEDG